jgi:hypothetical protein
MDEILGRTAGRSQGGRPAPDAADFIAVPAEFLILDDTTTI